MPERVAGWLQQGCNSLREDPSVDRRQAGKGVMGMAMTKEKAEATGLVYDLQGTLLEACSCGVLCPCWVGEDPDGGTCDAFVAYHFDAGTVKRSEEHTSELQSHVNLV